MLTLEEAIDIVARHAIHCASTDDGRGVEWGDYPEIGEDDWLKIQARVKEIAKQPPFDDYNAAYDLLEARANHHDKEGEDEPGRTQK